LQHIFNSKPGKAKLRLHFIEKVIPFLRNY